MIRLAIVAAVALLLGTLLWAEARGRTRLGAAAKVLASSGFVAIALVGGSTDSLYGRWVLAALALSWLGDALLVGAGMRWLMAGLGTFLVAHAAFAAAFLVPGQAVALTSILLAALALPAVLVGRWLLPHVRRGQRVPVVLYMVAVTAMLATAVASVAAWGAPWTVPVGAALFWASDITVARDRFVTPAWRNRAVGLPAYYAGQVLLAWSVTTPIA